MQRLSRFTYLNRKIKDRLNNRFFLVVTMAQKMIYFNLAHKSRIRTKIE